MLFGAGWLGFGGFRGFGAGLRGCRAFEAGFGVTLITEVLPGA
jgi:hypothetical protein